MRRRVTRCRGGTTTRRTTSPTFSARWRRGSTWWRTRSSATARPSAATLPTTLTSTARWRRGMRRHRRSRGELRLTQGERSMSIFSRRHFMKTTGAVVAAASVGAPRLGATPLRMAIGLQLYSVRDLLPKDFDGTLAKVRAAGYTEVEAAGYDDRTAKAFRTAMDQAGLRCVSTHHALPLLLEKGDELIDYGHMLG